MSLWRPRAPGQLSPNLLDVAVRCYGMSEGLGSSRHPWVCASNLRCLPPVRALLAAQLLPRARPSSAPCPAAATVPGEVKPGAAPSFPCSHALGGGPVPVPSAALRWLPGTAAGGRRETEGEEGLGAAGRERAKKLPRALPGAGFKDGDTDVAATARPIPRWGSAPSLPQLGVGERAGKKKKKSSKRIREGKRRS